jgi:hypothetical protein
LTSGVPRIRRHQDAAGDHVEREQEHDEAQILDEHCVRESRGCGRRAVGGGERRQRKDAPGEGELPVVAVPQPRKQERPGRDGDEDADERQRPWPAERRAVKRGGGMCRARNNQKDRSKYAAVEPLMHRAGARVRPHAEEHRSATERRCFCELSCAAMRL